MDLLQKGQTIAGIVIHASDHGMLLSKTHLQKVAYFLQQLELTPQRFRFVMYHYGPYSSEVSGITKQLEDVGLVQICAAENGYGFDLRPGEFASDVEGSLEPEAARVVDLLGRKEAWELELMATAHFVKQILSERNGASPAECELIDEVKRLKPRFSVQTIRRYLVELDTLENHVHETHIT